MVTYHQPQHGATASAWRDVAGNIWSGIKRLPATLAALVCTGVGISYNAQFAEQFGQTAIALAVASDVLKAMAGPMFMSAIRAREWGRAGSAFIVGLVTVVFSLVAAFGSAQHVREASTDERKDQIRAFDLAEKAKRDIDAELALLGPARPVDVVQQDITNFRIDADLWRRSKQCSDATKPATQTYCQPLIDLYKERGAAARKTELAPKIAELEAVLAKGKPAHADPQAAAIADWTGLEEDSIRRWISVLIVIAIETGAIFGSIMATRPTPRRREPEEIDIYARMKAFEASNPPPAPTPPSPKPRKRAKPEQRRKDVADFRAAFVKKNGHEPAPADVRAALGFPRRASHSYLREQVPA
jgi:hypothetical protein